ncbi:MAG TPA: VWA domain-containing protein, partial [Pyrinomonadaceae bacterium]|nr:VWA domain-containing protein [Pyrinomonadaceae bacterium]
MRLFKTSGALAPALAASLCLAPLAAAQQQSNPAPARQDDEVVRVDTELVQTDVAVFDKQGKFVDGLKAEQFELKVDGKPTQVSFFERVTAGSAREEALLSARAGAPAPRIAAPPDARARGRVVVFFVDDMHLSADSVLRTRKLVSQFVENEMGPDDMVAVASATGQIGFLQQFTDNKAVVRAALDRIVHRSFAVRDAESIPMTEYQALRIDQGDNDAMDYFSTQLLSESSFKLPNGGTIGPPPGGPANAKLPTGQKSGGLTPEGAKRMVRERAQFLLRQTSAVTLNMFGSLESLMRSSAQLPGRKLVFFISDGFFLNDRNTAFSDKLRQITDAAVRAGVVVYSMDTRGLVSTTDASSNRADMLGRLSRANTGEVSAAQDGLNLLAADTGGRAIFNTANLDRFMAQALDETSNYYVLAWRPETEAQKGGKFKRIEIGVAGRPDLTVRLPRGYLAGLAAQPTARTATNVNASATTGRETPKPDAAELQAALTAFAPQRALPTMLNLTYLDVPDKGPVLTASTQVATDALSYGADDSQPAALDLAGVILNTEGKTVSGFKTRLSIKPLPAERRAEPGAGVVYSHRAPLPAGIYQVRVAARDETGKRVGSAYQWVEIP